ncbi:hypothetical protein FOA52_011871, partial [Chlamydomonas sp. UWO 241]
PGRVGGRMALDKKKDEGTLTKICRDTSKMATEQMKGLSSQVIKQLLFNNHSAHSCRPGAPASMEM